MDQQHVTFALVAIGALTLLNTGILIGGDAPTGMLASDSPETTQPPTDSEPSAAETTEESETTLDIEVPPTGTPDVYGETLGVSYDDVSPTDRQQTEETINELAELDRNTELDELTDDELERYIDIASQISCEYCCDVPSIIREDGQKACVCEHSYAMRGLGKYLVMEHGDKMTDDEILAELSKWKTLFFPQQMEQKAEIMTDEGIDTDFVKLGSNEYRGIEQQAAGGGGGMVGSC